MPDPLSGRRLYAHERGASSASWPLAQPAYVVAFCGFSALSGTLMRRRTPSNTDVACLSLQPQELRLDRDRHQIGLTTGGENGR